MKLSIISFTTKGALLSEKIENLLSGSDFECTLYSACSFVDNQNIQKTNEPLSEWCQKRFEEKSAILFISALGIAVRGISSCVKDKLKDVPVMVVDENAGFVIPVLSGHVGGGNELSEKIASLLNAKAVITTATDINNKFAVDLFAKKNDLFISDKSGIAGVSAKILEGIDVKISVDDSVLFDKDSLPEGLSLVHYDKDEFYDVIVTKDDSKHNASLVLLTKDYILGIGCKKGKSFAEIEEFVKEFLKENSIDINRVSRIASIDLKKDEEGIKEFSEKYGIPFVTFSAEELNSLHGDFSSSDFVSKVTGVDNVSERAALFASGCNGKLIVEKTVSDGKTLALAEKETNILFE